VESWNAVQTELTSQTWFGDSAASTHMCNDDMHLYDWKTIHEEIRVGSGQTITATKVGILKLRINQTNGKTTNFTLSSAKFVPALWYNLFSLTAAMDKGFIQPWQRRAHHYYQ